MRLYADEDFPLPVVEGLRSLGHDVLTVQEDGLSSSADPTVLARAYALDRVILTHNRRDYERLHRQGESHSGIVSATQDGNHPALTTRIHDALSGLSSGRWCLRVNRSP